MPARPLSIEAISRLLEYALASSAADETEIAWLEVQRGRVEVGDRSAPARGRTIERTLLARVIDRGRVGLHRFSSCRLGEIENGVRSAIAASRVREPLPGLAHLAAFDEEELAAIPGLHDRQLAQLGARQAHRRVGGLLGAGERARFDWTDAAVAVVNSRGLRRATSVTAAELSVACGTGPGQGRAAAATRRLEDLDLERVTETARSRRCDDPPEPPIDSPPLVLAPEAMIAIVDLLSREAFSAKSYHDGVSFLREHLGVQVFDRSLNLRDDGTDPSGIAFPFDLEGSAKRPVDLIVKGAPKSPTLDQRQAAVLGLPPTAHAIGGNDSQALNLFLGSGTATQEELLREAEGGLWIGWIDRIETLEPQRLLFRARAGGVRRIRDGRLGPPVADLRWEDSLLRALSDIRTIGREPTVRLTGDRFLGGTSAPAMVLGPVSGLTVLG